MKKFLVLNINCQPLNPAQFGFKNEVPPVAYNIGANMFLMEEEDAKKFAEHMAKTQGLGNQKFHLVELKATVQQTIPPIEWVPVEKMTHEVAPEQDD